MSNKILLLEQGGAAVAVFSGFSGFISQNHELIWGIGVLVGSTVAIIGLILNVKRFLMDIDKNKAEKRINELKIKNLTQK